MENDMSKPNNSIKPRFGQFNIVDTMLSNGMETLMSLPKFVQMAALKNQLYIARYVRKIDNHNEVKYAIGKDLIYDFCYYDLNIMRTVWIIIKWSMTNSKEFKIAFGQYKNGTQN